MYYYIVDPQKISQREFERVQNLLYSSLSEYRVSGEIVRVTGLRTVNQLVENAFSHGSKTIVAVGSDDTLNEVINAIKDREMTVGYIPIQETEVGNLLGIRSIEHGAKTIGQRRIAELDLGMVNNNLFVSKLSFGLGTTETGFLKMFNFKLIRSLLDLPTFEIKFSANQKFQASATAVGGIISNSLIHGVIDVMLLPKLSKGQTLQYRNEILNGTYDRIPLASIIHVKKLEISSPHGLPMKAGSRVIAKTPVSIEIRPKALKIIVGKDRQF
jgi:diacylglycerol kinase family enzyme